MFPGRDACFMAFEGAPIMFFPIGRQSRQALMPAMPACQWGKTPRFLATPVQTVQEATDMIPRVTNPEFMFDQIGDVLGRPEVRTIPVRHRPFQQKSFPFGPLARCQLRRASGDGLRSDTGWSVTTHRVAPAHDGAGVAPHHLRHLGQGSVFPQKPDRTNSANLQLFRRTMRSHNGVVSLLSGTPLHCITYAEVNSSERN